MRTLLLAALISVFVVMRDGRVEVVTEQEALVRASEPEFAQALGHALPIRSLTYLEITQHRDGNSITDAAIERIELNR